MASNRITFFACDNGDASLIEAHGLTIMTDINYRQSEIEKDADRDFAPVIRKACNDDRLSVFVLTHPDEDHLRGFDEVFHLGKPDDRDEDPDDGDVSIIVNEIWCSPYAIDPNYETEVSKPVLDEIARRNKLAGTNEGRKDGNRLRVMSATDGATEKLANGVEWRLLAPTEEEADIPKAEAGASENSSNPSSLVIQWNVTVGSKISKVVLGGDSTVEIWERIHRDFGDEELSWHILLAPHHCSRHSMGRKEIKNGEEVFVWSEDAIAGLDHPASLGAHVVSSSRKFGSEHPPHPDARDRYYKILARGGKVDEDVRKRFKVTAGKKGENPEDIVFKFTSSGPALATLATSSVMSTPSSTGGGGYGGD